MPSPPTDGPDFSKNDGLLPVVVQDAHTGQVLMLAYMNAEAYRATCQTGLATYFSRSRNRLWQKGEQSGHRQQVQSILIDCDADTILLKVDQVGPACHEGYRSCFFRRQRDVQDNRRWEIVDTRLANPDQMYGSPTSAPQEPTT